MTQKLGTFMKSIPVRLGMALTALVLASASGATALAAPAAEPEPVFIRNKWFLVDYCLDQHYNESEPTTTVFAWRPCHTGGSQSPGNQLWRFEHLGNNTYKVTNKRGNFTWCLSAPNGDYSQVFAEHCTGGSRPPAKQIWQPEYVPEWGVNLLRSHNTTNHDQCMESVVTTTDGGYVKMFPCNGDIIAQKWTWSP